MINFQTLSVFSIFVISIILIVKWRFFKDSGLSLIYRLGIYFSKLIACVLIFILYTYYYPPGSSDMYKYFIDGKYIYENADNMSTYLSVLTGIGVNDPATQEFLDNTCHWNRQYLNGVWNDNRLLIRLNALFCPFTGSSLFGNSMLFLFISYKGLFYLFKTFRNYNINKYALIVAVFLMPNMLLWSSGLLKESLLSFNIGLFFFSVYQLKYSTKWKYGVYLALSIFIFALVKFYVFLCIIPATLFFLVARKHLWRTWFAVHIVCIVIGLLVSSLGDKVDLFKIMSDKQNDFVNMVEASPSAVGSSVEVPDMDANIFSLIKAAPTGLLHSFCRPYPWEWNSIVKLLAGLETYGILFLILFSIIVWWRKKRTFNSHQATFLMFTLSFVLIFFTVIGIATPVIGALVRYKIPALPFIAASILIIVSDYFSKKRFSR